jgi:predicted ferric reductase
LRSLQTCPARLWLTRCAAAAISCTTKAKLRLIEAPTKHSGKKKKKKRPRPPVVEITVPNPRRRVTAGQWVFLCVPQIGLLHWHPFTVSSAALDQEATLHFQCGGRWTRKMEDLARYNEDCTVRMLWLQGLKLPRRSMLRAPTHRSFARTATLLWHTGPSEYLC